LKPDRISTAIIIALIMIAPVILISEPAGLEKGPSFENQLDSEDEQYSYDFDKPEKKFERSTRSGQLKGGSVWMDDFNDFENSQSWRNISVSQGTLTLSEDEVLMLADNFSETELSEEVWNVEEGDGTILSSSGTLVALKQGWPQTQQTFIESRDSWQPPRRLDFRWNSIQESGINGYDHEIDVYRGPSSEERIWISIKGDKHVRLQSGKNSKVEGPPFFLNENHWYSMSCKVTIHTASLKIINDKGKIVNYQNLTHSYTNPGSIRILFADLNSEPGYFDVRADDVILYAGYKQKGELISTGIKLDNGYKFDRLSLSKTETKSSTSIKIDILDSESNEVIDGFSVLTSSKYDLSNLNYSQHRSISLRATLSGDTILTPGLRWWAVTMNKVDTWYDDFIDNSKIAQWENLIISDSRLMLKQGVAEGNFISLPITIPQNYYWDTLSILKDEPAGNSYLSVGILDSASGEPIGDYVKLYDERISLKNIDPLQHPTIQIISNFYRYSSKDPLLFAIELNWSLNQAPKFIDLQGPSTIYRGDSETYSVFATDPDETSDLLTLSIYHRKSVSPNEENPDPLNSWSNSYFEQPIFINGRWEAIFSPSRTAGIGFYDLKIIISDSLMEEISSELERKIEIISLPPPKPSVIISPAEPQAGHDIRSFVTLPPGYIKSDFTYQYKWYRNSQLENDLNANVVPYYRTAKYDLWKCEVVISDGLEISTPGFAEIFIENSPPEARADEVVFSMMEDPSEDLVINLDEYFFDDDNDKLSFTILPADFIEFSMDTSLGEVTLHPQSNWYGNSVLIVYASDDSADVYKPFIIKVLPSNDVPVISAVGNQLIKDTSDADARLNALEGEELTFKISAFDPDGDKLTYSTNRTDGAGNDDLDFMKVDSDSGMITFKTPSNGAKEFPLSIKVTDSNGSAAITEVTIVIQPKTSKSFEQFLFSANWMAIIIVLIICCFVFYAVTIGRTKLNKYLRKRYQKQLKGTGRYYANYPMVTKTSGYLEAGKYPGEPEDFQAFVNPYRVAMYSHNLEDQSGYGKMNQTLVSESKNDKAVPLQIPAVSIDNPEVDKTPSENQPVPLAKPALPPATVETAKPAEVINKSAGDSENKEG
jgi:hypothetical protein